MSEPGDAAGDGVTRAAATDHGGAPARRTRLRFALVRIAALAATLWLLNTGCSAAWDAYVLGSRGEVRPAAVVDVRHTSWGKADRVELAVAGAGAPDSVRVLTPRKDLEVGDTVDAVVDPRDPARAALAGDGWPWRQVLIPLFGVPLVVTLGLLHGRRWSPPPGAPEAQRRA